MTPSNRDTSPYLGRSLSMLVALELIYRDHEHSGYTLLKAIKEISHDDFDIKAGTLYPQLKKYADEGLIEERFETVQSKSSSRTREVAYYSLTKKGLQTLQLMREEWKSVSEILAAIIKVHEK